MITAVLPDILEGSSRPSNRGPAFPGSAGLIEHIEKCSTQTLVPNRISPLTAVSKMVPYTFLIKVGSAKY